MEKIIESLIKINEEKKEFLESDKCPSEKKMDVFKDTISIDSAISILKTTL